MTHIMGDLETMGNAPGMVIASLGALVFDPHSDELGDEFSMNIDEASALAIGLTTDPATVAWWNAPERSEARAAMLVDPHPIVEVLTAFSAFWVKHEGSRFWGQGKDYDLPILTAAYRAAGLDVPWKYNAPRDVLSVFDIGRDTRTLYEMGGVTVTKHQGTHHVAIDDARTQARDIQEAYRRLGLRAVRNSEAQRTLFAWLADVPEMLTAGTPLNPDQIDAVIHMIRGREDAFQAWPGTVGGGIPDGHRAHFEATIRDIAASYAPARASGDAFAVQMDTFIATAEPHVRDFRMAAMSIAADLAELGATMAPEGRDLAMRLAASELTGVASLLIATVKRHAGEDFSPGRFALVSYGIADETKTMLAKTWPADTSAEVQS